MNGKLELIFNPDDPKLGWITMNQPVTKEQWDAIRAILMRAPSPHFATRDVTVAGAGGSIALAPPPSCATQVSK